MSTRTVIVSLFVALALGLAAYILVQSGNKPAVADTGVVAVGEQVIDLDPALVKSLRVAVPGEPDQLVERVPAPAAGQWRLVIAGAGQNGTWAVMPERATSLLRVISAVRAISETEKSASVGDDPIVLELALRDGSMRTIRLASRTLGGSGLVEVDPAPGSRAGTPVRKAMVDDSLHRSLRSPGPRGWRETGLLAGSSMEASRIKLVYEEQPALAIGRSGGRVLLNEPVSCDADDAAAKKLFRVLDGMQVKDFLDGGAPEESAHGLNKPIARITLESDRRDIKPATGTRPESVEVHTAVREIAIGNPADTKKETRYARLEKDGPIVVIGAAGLERGLFDPAQYPSQVAVSTPAADIGTMVLEAAEAPAGSAAQVPAGAARRLVRKNEDWAQAGSGAEETVLSGADARAVQDLLVFMTKKPVASLSLERPAAYAPLGRFLALSPGGKPLEELEIGTSGGSTLILYTRTPGAGERRGVYRVYPSNELPTLLAPFAAAAKASTPPSAADATRDIVK